MHWLTDNVFAFSLLWFVVSASCTHGFHDVWNPCHYTSTYLVVILMQPKDWSDETLVLGQ